MPVSEKTNYIKKDMVLNIYNTIIDILSYKNQTTIERIFIDRID